MERTLRHLFTPQATNNHRPRVLHVEGLAIFVAIVIGAQTLVAFFSKTTFSLPSILGFSSSITASQVVEQTNRQRTALGLSPLTMNTQLNAAALSKGNNMCGEQYWAHISPSGTTPWVFMRNAGYRYAVAGENLARDFSDTGSMVDAWMASPTHKANIVNGKYKEIGVAVIDCNLLGHDTALVVQMFGSQVVSPVAAKPQVEAPSLPEPKNENDSQDIFNVPSQTPAPQQEEQVAGENSIPNLIANADPSIILSTPVPTSSFSPIFTPLQVMKAIMISVLITILFVLCIDLWLAHERKIVRIAGKNLAHIVFLSGVLIVVILIRSGVTL